MGKRPPTGYRDDPELRAAFEEGGRAIGRAIMWNPEQEDYFWKTLKGIGLWPRWYLTAFKNLYADENPRELRRSVKNRYRRKLAKRKARANLEEVRRKANDSELFQDGR